jgi:hypothetical protein
VAAHQFAGQGDADRAVIGEVAHAAAVWIEAAVLTKDARNSDVGPHRSARKGEAEAPVGPDSEDYIAAAGLPTAPAEASSTSYRTSSSMSS